MGVIYSGQPITNTTVDGSTNDTLTFAILREIAQYSFNFNEGEFLDALDLGLPLIDNGSCLFLMTEACSTSPQTPWGITGRIEIYQQ